LIVVRSLLRSVITVIVSLGRAAGVRSRVVAHTAVSPATVTSGGTVVFSGEHDSRGRIGREIAKVEDEDFAVDQPGHYPAHGIGEA